MTTVDLYPYLILIGASILVASARMLFHYRTQSSRGQQLILLNEELEYDLPDFLRSCWPILQEGRFVGIKWELDWFGTSISGSDANPPSSFVNAFSRILSEPFSNIAGIASLLQACSPVRGKHVGVRLEVSKKTNWRLFVGFRLDLPELMTFFSSTIVG